MRSVALIISDCLADYLIAAYRKLPFAVAYTKQGFWNEVSHFIDCSAQCENTFFK